AWLEPRFTGDAGRYFSFVIFAFLFLLLAAAVALFYSTVHGTLARWRLVTLSGLRIAGILALVLLFFRPVLAIVRGPAAVKPQLAIVVDASASMGYNDAANQPNRYRQAALAVQNTLVPRLGRAYSLQCFAYDGVHTSPLSSADQYDTIVPNADVTDLGAALSLPSNAAATVLFSDGIHNGPTTIDAEMAHLGDGGSGGGNTGHVHTVRVGTSELEPSSVPDIAVVSIDGPQTAIVNNQVTLTATIKSTAMSDRTVRVQLFSKDGVQGTGGAGQRTALDEQRLVLRSSPAGQTVQLHFTPEKVGRAVVRVQVPVDPGERSDANNQQDFSLLVTDPKLTVLYVEGRVRPEVGPLRRTLEQDPNLALVSMVQTVAGRFEMTGLKAGDDLKGLPTNLAQWKRFKVVVLGDLDASFLNTQQQKDLEQIVRDGAGLVMIGGQNSFAPGGWDRTTLASLLPVSLEKVAPPQINAPFVMELTSVGGAHPIFRGIASYFLTPEGKKIGETVPDFSGCVALGPPKAGATVLAVHPTEKVGNAPATVLAVQQYGKGRSAAFAADTTFRWRLVLGGQAKDSPYNRFWGQIIRWLASEDNLEKKTGASVTAMLAKERFESGESVPLRAAVTDKEGQATAFAKTWADITSPDNRTTHVELLPKGNEAGDIGIYVSSSNAYKPSMAGTYKVAFGASKDNGDLGKDLTSFFVLPAAGERDILAAQPRTLKLISDRTAGTAVDISAIDALADRILADLPPAPAASRLTVPLSYPRPYFAIFIVLLALEWFLRRQWQLQ
ncbi:MAG TPA: glutamine amidotransferase, partial [Phycisphaerae bacterium]|nr:glutamine amidotransferase [Phycisphaerae bacterium]